MYVQIIVLLQVADSPEDTIPTYFPSSPSTRLLPTPKCVSDQADAATTTPPSKFDGSQTTSSPILLLVKLNSANSAHNVSRSGQSIVIPEYIRPLSNVKHDSKFGTTDDETCYLSQSLTKK